MNGRLQLVSPSTGDGYNYDAAQKLREVLCNSRSINIEVDQAQKAARPPQVSISI
jgi:hypothetical protein